MIFETLDLLGVDKIGERTSDELVGIITQQLAAGDVDFLDHAAFVEARVPDRREVVQICVPQARMRELLLRLSKLTILNLQFELVYLKFFDQIRSCVSLQRFER